MEDMSDMAWSECKRCGLSDREIEIAQLLIKGFTNAAIAIRLGVEHKTVRNCASNIYRKLDLPTSRMDRSKRQLAVAKLERMGLKAG